MGAVAFNGTQVIGQHWDSPNSGNTMQRLVDPAITTLPILLWYVILDTKWVVTGKERPTVMELHLLLL